MEDLTNCQHCKMTGTCSSGSGATSCERCVAQWEQRYPKHFKAEASYTGLVCSVCWGRGLAETSQRKWDYRFPAVLAAAFVMLAFSLLFWGKYMKLPPEQSLPFVGTLVGSITGFYFGGSKRGGVTRPASPVAQDQIGRQGSGAKKE